MCAAGLRADVFAMLAACYAEPGPDIAGIINRLCSQNPISGDTPVPEIQKLKILFEKTDINDLRLDHARLFMGPFQLAAAPFGSVYLEAKRTLMGESTLEITEIYREAGLEMANDFHNPPDHIIAELEFLAYLLSAQAEAGADTDAAQNIEDIKQRFINRHLGAWIEPFTIKLEQGAETGFYRLLGSLTRKMVTAEPGF